MILKKYEDRLDFLNRNIDKINKAVSDFLGFDVNFEVRTFQSGADNIITLRDDTNIRDKCDAMSGCFKSVGLSDFSIWWDDDYVCIAIDCIYVPIGGIVYNDRICEVCLVGDEVSVRSAG